MHEAAVRLLARREHAAAELIAKLVARGFEREAAADELERLAAEGLQSDDRFAALLVEQRVNRGDGPLKLRAALAERGIEGSRADTALVAFEEDWSAHAQAALERRFGTGAPETQAERAKRMRFLQGRGFPVDIVRRTVDGR